jgi:hypothetical protein
MAGVAAASDDGRPSRLQDRHLAMVEQANRGCIYCGASELAALPGSGAKLGLVFCATHVRWAMAARRERYGKQARNLRKLLQANCRLNGGDSKTVKVWLRF